MGRGDYYVSTIFPWAEEDLFYDFLTDLDNYLRKPISAERELLTLPASLNELSAKIDDVLSHIDDELSKQESKGKCLMLLGRMTAELENVLRKTNASELQDSITLVKEYVEQRRADIRSMSQSDIELLFNDGNETKKKPKPFFYYQNLLMADGLNKLIRDKKEIEEYDDVSVSYSDSEKVFTYSYYYTDYDSNQTVVERTESRTLSEVIRERMKVEIPKTLQSLEKDVASVPYGDINSWLHFQLSEVKKLLYDTPNTFPEVKQALQKLAEEMNKQWASFMNGDCKRLLGKIRQTPGVIADVGEQRIDGFKLKINPTLHNDFYVDFKNILLKYAQIPDENSLRAIFEGYPAGSPPQKIIWTERRNGGIAGAALMAIFDILNSSSIIDFGKKGDASRLRHFISAERNLNFNQYWSSYKKQRDSGNFKDSLYDAISTDLNLLKSKFPSARP